MWSSMRSPVGDHFPPNEGVLPESGTAPVPSRFADHTRCAAALLSASKEMRVPPGAVWNASTICVQIGVHGVMAESSAVYVIARRSLPSSAAVQRSNIRPKWSQPKYSRAPSVDQATSISVEVAGVISGCAFAPSASAITIYAPLPVCSKAMWVPSGDHFGPYS